MTNIIENPINKTPDKKEKVEEKKLNGHLKMRRIEDINLAADDCLTIETSSGTRQDIE